MNRSKGQLAGVAFAVTVTIMAGRAIAEPPVLGPDAIIELVAPLTEGSGESTTSTSLPSAPSSKPLGTPQSLRDFTSETESQSIAGEPDQRNLPALWRTLLPLAGVIGVILLLAALVRKSARTGGGLLGAMGAGGRAPSGVLSVLGRYPVGGGHQFVLLKLDRRVLLLAQHTGWRARSKSGGFRVLCEISDPEDVASILLKTQDEQGASIAKRFGEYLDEQAPPGDSLVDLTTRRVQRSPQGDVVELLAPELDQIHEPPIASRTSPLGSLRDRLIRMRRETTWADAP